jgi:hypothetical protein
MEGFNFTRAVTGAATGEETVRVDTEPKLLVVDEQGHLPIDFILRSGLLTGSDVVVNLLASVDRSILRRVEPGSVINAPQRTTA